MIKNLNWLELEVYFPIDASLFESEEMSEVEKLSAGIVEGYEIGVAYFNIAQNTIQSLLPKCFIPKGKTHRKFYTEVIFTDGSFAFVTSKPNDVYVMIDEFIEKLPISSNED